MKQSNINLKINEKKFLLSLLDNGNQKDTEIARKIGISKVTASRIRKKLELNFIEEYIPIINLSKVGVNIFSVIVFKWDKFNNNILTKKTFSELENHPHTIFLANGEGSSELTSVIFMGFEDLESYHNYLKEFRRSYGNHISKMQSLLLPSKDVIKNDFTKLIKHILEEIKK